MDFFGIFLKDATGNHQFQYNKSKQPQNWSKFIYEMEIYINWVGKSSQLTVE